MEIGLPTGASAPADRGHEERLRLALDAGRMGTWEWDISTGDLAWSEQLGPIHGLAQGESVDTFEEFVALVHPDDRDLLVSSIQNALEDKSEYTVEFRVPFPDGTDHWVAGRGRVFTDDHDNPTTMIGVGMDITDQKRLLESERASRAAAETAGERLSFLAEATRVVSISLDHRETFERIARLTVPRLADWCGIDMIRADGTSEWVAGVHVDPTKDDLIRTLRANYPTDMESDPMKELLSTGEGQLYPEITDEMIEAGAKDERHAAMLKDLGLTSILIVPLSVRGRVIGVLSLASSTRERNFDQIDLELASELARRCAIAVENSRLYEERAHIARILQRALLPADLPTIPGMALAASYHPAGEGNDVGGDFYDVFDAGSASWALAIGDVCGKGARAAALTGLARHTIRAAALPSARPDSVVPVVNQALLRECKEEEFVTMAYGCLEKTEDGCKIWFSRAGHPAPMVIRSDGRVEKVGTVGDLLGVFHDVEVAIDTVTMMQGEAMLLYTDGVTEARDENEIFGDARLIEVLKGCAGLDPKSIIEKVEDAVLDFGGEARDDIALLALRAD